MQIMEGIASGAVLQRDAEGKSITCIRAVFSGIPRSSMGEIIRREKDTWILRGIPAGGPYSLTLSDDEGSETFADLYVGDVWLLAGQSNMEGAGHMTAALDALPEKEDLRAFYMDDVWRPARPQLHQQWLSRDAMVRQVWENAKKSRRERGFPEEAERLNQRRGVGPGYFFAQNMRECMGVPQAVIPCAVGGASIRDWQPNGEDNFLSACLRRLKCCGGVVRGLFWAQGEGETNEIGCQRYPEWMKAMLDALRPFGLRGQLPTVQLQLFRHTLPGMENIGQQYWWSMFRQMQLRMSETMPLLATVATNDLECDDLIHLSSESQAIAGKRAACAMRRLITGEGPAEPKLKSVALEPDDLVPQMTNIRLTYENVEGALRASGVPSGFKLGNANEYSASMAYIHRIIPKGNEVLIQTELHREDFDDLCVWYGYGHTTYCNITDEGGRAIPSMGPVPLGHFAPVQAMTRLADFADTERQRAENVWQLPEVVRCGLAEVSGAYGDYESMPQRIAEQYELNFFLSDAKGVTLDGIFIPIVHNSIMVVHPGQEYQFLQTFEILNLSFRLKGRMADILNGVSGVFPAGHSRRYQDLMMEIARLNEQEERNELLLHKYMMDLINSVISDAQAFNNKSLQNAEISRQACRFIEQHFSEPLSLKDIAASVNLSPNYSHTLFSETMKKTPREHLIACRIKAACQMLCETDDSIIIVAEKSGFSGQAYFNRVFKNEVGITPSQYRKQFRDFMKTNKA